MDLLPTELKLEIIDKALESEDFNSIINLCQTNKEFYDLCLDYDIWEKIGKKIYKTDVLDYRYNDWQEWVTSDDKLFIKDSSIKYLISEFFSMYNEYLNDTYDHISKLSNEDDRNLLYTVLDFYSSFDYNKVKTYIEMNFKWFKQFLLNTKQFNYIGGRYYLLYPNKKYYVNVENYILQDDKVFNGYWYHLYNAFISEEYKILAPNLLLIVINLTSNIVNISYDLFHRIVTID